MAQRAHAPAERVYDDRRPTLLQLLGEHSREAAEYGMCTLETSDNAIPATDP